jgi:hypothetical protein
VFRIIGLRRLQFFIKMQSFFKFAFIIIGFCQIQIGLALDAQAKQSKKEKNP